MPLEDIGYNIAVDLRLQIDNRFRGESGDEPLHFRLVTDYHVVDGRDGGDELGARALVERKGAAVGVRGERDDQRPSASLCRGQRSTVVGGQSRDPGAGQDVGRLRQLGGGDDLAARVQLSILSHRGG